MNITFKPIASEKAVKLIELENTLTFNVDMKAKKQEIRRQFEEVFGVKVERIRTLIKGNRKIVYIRLKKENPAIDVATKFGMM